MNIETDLKLPESKLEILHEIPGVCAWVGKKVDEETVLNAVPFFFGQSSKTVVGLVLLADLARQAHMMNRIGNKFSVPNIGQIQKDLETTYGNDSIEILRHTYVGRKLQAETRRGLARHLQRVLRVNYIECAKDMYVDGARVRLRSPATGLLNIPDGVAFTSLEGLVDYLGNVWLGLEQRLRAKNPKLQSRDELFELIAQGIADSEVTEGVTDLKAETAS